MLFYTQLVNALRQSYDFIMQALFLISVSAGRRFKDPNSLHLLLAVLL